MKKKRFLRTLSLFLCVLVLIPSLSVSADVIVAPEGTHIVHGFEDKYRYGGSGGESRRIDVTDTGYVIVQRDNATEPGYGQKVVHEQPVYEGLRGVIAYYYDKNGKYLYAKGIAQDLPLYGGFFMGEDAYYYLSGAMNDSEDDNVEVLRIVKYSKDFERLGQCSVRAIETVGPFDTGTVSMAEYGGRLYIHTSQLMYMGVGGGTGMRHQGNMSLIVNQSDMKLISYNNTAVVIKTMDIASYAGHSFTQWVDVSSDGVVYTADLCDGNPVRGLILAKRGSYDFSRGTKMICPFAYWGMKGDNYCGAALCGIQAGNRAVISAGVSISQTEAEFHSDYTYNVYITRTPNNNFTYEATEVVWLTNYPDNVRAKKPSLKQINDNLFLLIWDEITRAGEKTGYGFGVYKYVLLDGAGNVLTDVRTWDNPLPLAGFYSLGGGKVVYPTSVGASYDPAFEVVTLDFYDKSLSDGVVSYQVRQSDYADALYSLGLFRGTGVTAAGGPIYDLDKQATREQVLVMLIRLLGEERAALASTAVHPFKDVPSDNWAYKYVAYAYEKGYTLGMGSNLFGMGVTADANMYLTFLLRALGYSDSEGDFSYALARSAAAEHGIIKSGEYGSGNFYRGDCAYTSYMALRASLKGSSLTLGDSLYAAGAIPDKVKAIAASELTIQASAAVSAPSQPVADGAYYISANQSSRYGLGAVNKAYGDGSQVDPNSGSPDLFLVVPSSEEGWYCLESGWLELRLGVAGNNQTEGTSVIYWSATGSESQRFRFESAGDRYYIISKGGLYVTRGSKGLMLTANRNEATAWYFM